MVEQVGRYKIKGQLGRGAMGVVYLADDPLLNRQAAIKTVDLGMDDAAQREFMRTRLLRDARAAAGLSHPNIVGVFDVVEAGDSAYLVMEYVAGQTLAEVLNRTAIPDPAFTVRVLRDMAAALDYTHARGIVHRDIKPANVMIDVGQTAKIMDFGIARIADTRTTTPTGMVMGTVEYMSPEQIKGETVDGRSDQFALAAVAYRMLTGATLFGQHSLATLAYKIVNEAPIALRMRNTALPAAVDAAVSKALSKSAQDRYGSCSEFVEALASSLAMPRRDEPTLTLPLPHGAAAVPATQPPPAKRGWGPSIAVVAALVLASGGLTIWRPWSKPAAPQAPVGTVPQAPAATVPKAAVATIPHPETQPPSPTPAKPVGSSPPTSEVAANRSQPKIQPKKEEPAAEPLDETPPALDNSVADPVPSQTPAPAADAYKHGVEFLNAGQLGPAIGAFSKAIALRPEWPNPLLDRGKAYQRQGDCNAAIRDLDQFLRKRPKNPYAHTYRGACYARFKDDDRALDDFNSAIALKPDAVKALYGRAMIRMRRSSYRAAIDDLSEAIRASPNYGQAYQGRGNAKLKLGDRAGAEADFNKARELHSK